MPLFAPGVGCCNRLIEDHALAFALHSEVFVAAVLVGGGEGYSLFAVVHHHKLEHTGAGRVAHLQLTSRRHIVLSTVAERQYALDIPFETLYTDAWIVSLGDNPSFRKACFDIPVRSLVLGTEAYGDGKRPLPGFNYQIPGEFHSLDSVLFFILSALIIGVFWLKCRILTARTEQGDFPRMGIAPAGREYIDPVKIEIPEKVILVGASETEFHLVVLKYKIVFQMLRRAQERTQHCQSYKQ